MLLTLADTPAPELTLTALEMLTPPERAQLMRAWEREAQMRDQGYLVDTPIGPHVKRYLDYKRWRGLEDVSLENREVPLKMFCVHYADMGVERFTGRDGAKLVEEFLMAKWGEAADATKVQRASCLRDFMNWCYREGLVAQNPVDFEEKRRGAKKTRRQAHDRAKVTKLIVSQPRWNWRLGIALFARMGFRLNDLRECQLGHFDFNHKTVDVFGKGAKAATLRLYPDLSDDLERYILERAGLFPDDYRLEHLVFPLKAVRLGSYPNYRKEYRENRRLEPYTRFGMDAWFRGCWERAQVGKVRMHELRHTAATEFHYRLAKGDYELTRQFCRHEDIATTARYVHAPPNQLVDAMKLGDGFWDEAQS